MIRKINTNIIVKTDDLVITLKNVSGNKTSFELLDRNNCNTVEIEGLPDEQLKEIVEGINSFLFLNSK